MRKQRKEGQIADNVFCKRVDVDGHVCEPRHTLEFLQTVNETGKSVLDVLELCLEACKHLLVPCIIAVTRHLPLQSQPFAIIILFSLSLGFNIQLHKKL